MVVELEAIPHQVVVVGVGQPQSRLVEMPAVTMAELLELSVVEPEMEALEPVIHLVPQAVEMKTTAARVSLAVEEGAAALTRPEGVRAVLRFMAVGVGLEAKPLAGLQAEPLFLEEKAVMVP